MAEPLKYFNVNWVNGMKIRKEHFIQQENSFDDKLKDLAAGFLTRFNYGLIPVWNEKEVSFKVAFKTDNQKFLRVTVFELRAFTEGGARIEIVNPDNPVEFSADLSFQMESAKNAQAKNYFILLTVDLFGKETFGELNDEEEPPRFPYSKPSLKISVVPENELSQLTISAYSLSIGKLEILPDRIQVLGDYIPPCMSTRSHSRLIDFHANTDKFFNQVEADLISIINKIKEKGQDSSLATSVLLLSENLLNFVSVNNLNIKWHLPDLPPVRIFELIASFARLLRNSINCLTAASKEELLNYFTNWTELKQGDFEKLLVYCINFNYDHREISISIDQFSEFIQIIASLFTKLESLTYIGKKKETNIFVKEQPVKRSFLAE